MMKYKDSHVKDSQVKDGQVNDGHVKGRQWGCEINGIIKPIKWKTVKWKTAKGKTDNKISMLIILQRQSCERLSSVKWNKGI